MSTPKEQLKQVQQQEIQDLYAPETLSEKLDIILKHLIQNHNYI